MKLERLQESVPVVASIFIGLSLALLCGYMIGDQQGKTAGLIIAGILIVAFLILVRERVWMVIPALSSLNGKVNVLPLPFTVAQLGILLAFAMFLILKALKVIRIKPKIGALEIGMFVMVAYVGTVFLRNPVGFEALGSDRVGGKPYADIIVACLGYWVLARSIVNVRQALFVPLLGLVGSSTHAAMNFVAEHFPSTIGPLANLYSGIAAAEGLADPLAPTPEPVSRFGYLQGLGGGLTSSACFYWRPFTLLNPLNYGRFLMFMLGAFAILLSGFRSAFFGIFELFLVISYFRRGWSEVARGAIMALTAVALLCLLQGNVFDLPIPAQRALSFLPGRWEQAAKEEAEGSTEWRTEMWKTMLTEDKYIQNKWLGDGFGFTHYQLETMTANVMTGNTQENFMITGGVHSGPVTTIRYVGVVGLIIFWILLVAMGVKGFKLIRRAQGTLYFPFVLSVGFWAIVFPFNFTFIFGSFDGDLPNAIMSLGMLKLAENSLDAYEATDRKSSPEVIQPPKVRPVSRRAPVGSPA